MDKLWWVDDTPRVETIYFFVNISDEDAERLTDSGSELCDLELAAVRWVQEALGVTISDEGHGSNGDLYCKCHPMIDADGFDAFIRRFANLLAYFAVDVNGTHYTDPVALGLPYFFTAGDWDVFTDKMSVGVNRGVPRHSWPRVLDALRHREQRLEEADQDIVRNEK